MLISSLLAGLAALVRRPRLALLLYAANLLVAILVAVPVYSALAGTVGGSGFGPELARGFDLVLWADVFEEAAIVLRGVWAQVLWAALLYVAWKSAATVGLVQALRDGGLRSFWQGVGRYAGRALGLRLLYGAFALIWVLALVFTAILLNLLWQGEVGAYWVNLVVIPALAAVGFAQLDLMQDYSCITLVSDEESVSGALSEGVRWGWQRPGAVAVYAVWLVPAALLWGAPFLLDASLPAATAGGIWGLFLLQQVVLAARASATVGWLASEVALFETVRRREALLIAEGTPPADVHGMPPYGASA